MEQNSPGRSDRLRDDDFDVQGARNFSKMEKLESERTQTTTSRSVTTNGGATRHMNGDDSSEILVDNALENRTFAVVGDSDDWRSKKTEQHSGTQATQRYDAEERHSTAVERRSAANEQDYSTRSLGSRERNTAAAEMAYRMAGLPAADVELRQVSKRRSKVVSTDGQSKRRGGLRELEDTADMIVEDTMEHAIEALYGKKRRRKMARDVNTRSTTSGETRSLDRQARTTTTMDARARSGYDTTMSENRALGRTVNETTSKDQSRKKAVSYLRVKKDDEDIEEEDLDMRRPASADGRLVDRVDYTAVRRARALHPLPHTAAASKTCYQTSYMSPATSHYQRRTAANVITSRQLSAGYSSEAEAKQSAGRTNRRQFSGDDSDFSTKVEIRNPRSAQLQIAANGGYTSDESETWNNGQSKSRAPTLTKGMVTKILHGDRPLQPPPSTVSEVRRTDALTSPVQFTTSPPPSINVLLSPTVYRDSQFSAVVPVGSTAGESRAVYGRPSAVDDNFLLQRAAAYDQSSPYLARQTGWYGTGGGTGRSTPTSIQTMVENDERPLYTAFSNEPIIVANLDDDYNTRSLTSMRRTQSLFALDAMSPAGTGIGRSQTPTYSSSRPDIRMTNRQVLNLYLFNKTSPADAGRDKAAELETVTHTMTFDDEAHRIRTGNKETQTSTTRREPVPPTSAKRRRPTPSRVTEETVIVKPSITETRETEMIGDVFADRRRISLQEPEPLVVQAREELPQEEPEEEILETTVVEEKQQRIEMTIREDLEFSLQRSRGTAKAVTGSTDESKIEPWWIPDAFEAFVERKRQKITQTRDVENKDDHSKRIDVENNAAISNDNHVAPRINTFENHSNNYETDSGKQSRRRNQRAAAGDGNIRIPIFLENRYQSPMHGMTSPSSNLVRSKMTMHSEPEMSRRNQYYLGKRDKYYGSLFDDSYRRPLSVKNKSSENSLPVTSSISKKRQQTLSTDVHADELRPEVLSDDEASDYSSSAAGQEPRSSERRYVSSYSHYISPTINSSDPQPSVAGKDQFASSRSATGIHASRQPLTSTTDAIFPTSKIISLPNVEAQHGKGGTLRGPGDDQLPSSLDHFDRVLTEIEDELPPPPPPPPLPLSGGGTQARNTPRQSSHASQREYVVESSSTYTPPTQKKSKPPPPEKSWKRSSPSPLKPGKLYSSKERPAADASTSSGTEKQKSTAASRSEIQSTSSKAADKETSADSSAAAVGRQQQQQPAGTDFRRQLGDHSYISLSLTEPVQREDQRRRIEVVKQPPHQHAEQPGAFRYGWTSHEHKTRKHSPPPGRYQLRHSRYPAEDYDIAATAF